MSARFLAVASTLALGFGVSSCGGHGSPQLLDGREPPPLPAALADLDGAAMTIVEVRAVSGGGDRRGRSCERRVEQAKSRSPIVERMAPVGASITFRAESGGVVACDEIAGTLSASNNPESSTPWCGGSYGRLYDGVLRDPRLDLCWPADGGPLTAFAWINPRPGVRWIVIRDGETRHVYEVAAGLPVRVARKLKATVAESASFDVEEYASDGTRLRSYTLDTKVAG